MGKISDISVVLGHDFKNEHLLKIALTHSSTGKHYNYERLEFLGDRVLGLVIAEALYARFPAEPEGDLAKRLAALVQGKFLAKIAREMELGKFMSISQSERDSGGDENENILADVMESLLGALYLDGGYAPCKKLIAKLWEPHIGTMEKPPQHPKTQLQEWAQKQGLPLPDYTVIGRTGPDHSPVFEMQIEVKGFKPLSTTGRSRQVAEKKAAKLFVETHADKING